ncbi:hypothetical protein ABZ929_00855 [Streptomyces physcomitrii]|uniref:alpha/beta fold hydrolase n=1 Tax=Streptomyces physcomitrii TaxID=2724184 RepID=UPI0033E13661
MTATITTTTDTTATTATAAAVATSVTAADRHAPAGRSAGRFGVRFTVSRDFDRAETARAVVCFGGIGGGDDVQCWQTAGPELLAGHDVAVFVTPDWTSAQQTGTGVGELAAALAEDVHRVAELCGLELDLVTAVGYSAGCDLALAVGSALDSVERVVCVSGYAGGEFLPGCVYLALRRGRSLGQLRALLRWRKAWRGFVPRRSLDVTLAVAGRAPRRGGGTRASALASLDERVARRCTEHFLRRIPEGALRLEVCPVAGHTWPAWRESAIRLLRAGARNR